MKKLDVTFLCKLGLVAMALTPFTAEPVMASVNLRLEPAHTGLWVAQDDGDDFLGELEDTESVGGAETGQIEAGEEDETEMAPREDLGGATGFVFKRGFYTASDLGAFLRFGGYTYDEQTSCLRCKARTNSDLAPYIGLAVGYDMTEWLGLQLSFGSGYVAGAAPVQGTNQAHLDSTYPLDHAITMINAAAVFSWYVWDRLALEGKLFGGLAFLSPAPMQDVDGLAFDGGAGVGLQYATLLTDVIVGIDVNYTQYITRMRRLALFRVCHLRP